MTIKVLGSISEDAPDFSVASSPTNRYTELQMVNLENGNPINGSDGLSYTGTDNGFAFEANVNAMSWIALEISGYSAGALTSELSLTTNE